MKRLLLLLFALPVFFPSSVVAQETDTLSQIIQRVDGDSSAISSFTDRISSQADGADFLAVFLVNSPQLRTRASQSRDYYSNLAASSDLSSETKNALNQLAMALDRMVNSLASMEAAIDAEDDQAFSNAIGQFDVSVEQYNQAVDSLNAAGGFVGGDWYAALMFWSTVISFFIALYLFVISRSKAVLPSEKHQNEFEFALFKSSLWPFGGSLVSWVWYELTPAGGTFYVLWGPVLFGYFYFARAVFQYFTTMRPQILRQKEEETKKVSEALSTK